MSEFNYAGYFGNIGPLADALRDSPERLWVPSPAEMAQPHDYVLYLGCNVLRTMHLAEAMVAVVKSMAVDALVMGGPANCCGIVQNMVGDEALGLTIANRTMDRFGKIATKAVLTYCPSCNVMFDGKRASGELTSAVPYQHVTQFIAENLSRLRFKTPVPRRVGLHMHMGTPRAKQDSENCHAILSAIPGLEVVPLPVDESWGYICSPNQIEAMGAEHHHGLVGDMYATAKQAGCDAIVTVYHTCYRELARTETEFGLEWLNYVELLAQSLDLGAFPPRYKELAQAGDPEAACQALAGRALERGGDLDALRRSAAVHFTPGQSPVSLSLIQRK